MSVKIIEVNGEAINLETFLAAIDDLGTLTSSAELRDALEGTEHLIDTIPQIAWLWGHLSGLEMMALVQAAMDNAGLDTGVAQAA